VRNLLTRYASEIEAESTREESIAKFYEDSWHYKGLRDFIVPGVPQKEWEKQVQTLSKYAKTSVKARKQPAWWSKWFT
jgi:hypothetical protein